MSSKRKGTYAAKMKRATHILFYRRHQKPGVRGWELHKALGSDYPKVLDVLDDFLKPLDLQVKTVFQQENAPEKPTLDELDKARFYVTLRGDLQPKETKMIGWRIDDLAGLAITISYIISKKGQAARRDVEELLGEKIPGWKIGLNIDRYVRYGYLQQDDNEQLYLDWRTRAEVDEKALIDLLLRSEEERAAAESSEPQDEETDEESDQPN
ncbi:MAG: hypothetical protein NWF05_00340 [Candidatus Bathyarchaeota archaeon]|nr:hypothetical protein [Candidatus Bathyarchaeota archaeon]